MDLFSLRGKTALVTGGSSGIGLMIARGFLDVGATVIIASRSAERCQNAMAELSGYGDCAYLVGDVSRKSGCEELAESVRAETVAIDVLVNSAGAHATPSAFADYPDSEWDALYDTHVKAPFNMTRALLPDLQSSATDADPARVINIGSVAGAMVLPVPMFAYQSAKAALHHLTRRLAKELAPHRITVNAILPGVVPTPWFDGNQAALDAARSTNPLGRNNNADDLAGAATFLASRAGAYVTGVLPPVDGGMSTTI